MTSQVSLGISVLVHEEVDATLECLHGLQKAGFFEAARVCLVDNASSPPVRGAIEAWARSEVDDSLRWLGPEQADVQHWDTGMRLVRAPENGGYATGNNIGLRLLLRAGAAWVWLLNNDVDVDGCTADRLLAEVSGRDLRTVIGFRLHDPRHPQDADVLGGGRLRRLRAQTCFVTPRRPGSCDYVSGAALLVSAHALRDSGLLSEDHFLYWEDVELCHRLVGAGASIEVLEDVELVHRTGASTGSGGSVKSNLVHRESARGCVLFYRRHLPALVALAVVARLLHALRVAVGDGPRAGAAVLQGTVSGLRARLTPPPAAPQPRTTTSPG